ncbi:MAG: saccharopine dehydrogenase [Polyangiaceae bacterium]|nr:saccharopine dehydrogenase [Polyangiaceae bacterium]
MRALVLGAGTVGATMAWDMRNRGYAVSVADVRADAVGQLSKRWDVEGLAADLSDGPALVALAEPFDIVLGALPSVLGHGVLTTMIAGRKSYVDVSFMREDPLLLDEAARRAGVTAIVDCGVAPGLTHLLAGWGCSRLDPCERIDILVGGLPVVRTRPYEYKAPYHPFDVIEMYTRPARSVEHGAAVVRDALSEPDLVEFDEIGTLEAFNTDGLRTLIRTLRVPNLRERTLRYPGHAALMRILRETGFFSKRPVRIDDCEVSPLSLTARLLFPLWRFDDQEEDLTVMRVVAEGRRGARFVRIQWELFDRYDRADGLRSMSRVTAFPATTAADLIARGAFTRAGVHPPETLGLTKGMPERFISALQERGVRLAEREEALDDPG